MKNPIQIIWIGCGTSLIVGLWALFWSPPTHRIQLVGVAQGAELKVDTTVPIWVTRKMVMATITGRLDQIDKVVSTYHPDSELTRWNQSNTTQSIRLSLALQRYFTIGDQLHSATHGRWDGTVYGHPIGWTMVQQNGPYRVKPLPTVRITFDSIAQGDAVQALTVALRQIGAHRVVIQMGGEVGVWSIQNRAQRVGIAKPNTHYGRVLTSFVMHNGYVSTSGIDNVHNKLVDPKSGKSRNGSVQSMVVMAKTGAIADGAATALRLIPNAQWSEVADRLGITAIWVVDSNGTPIQIRRFNIKR